MPTQWYVRRDGKKHGPFTPNQLKKLAETEQISASDSVWRDGMQEWSNAGKVKGLFPSVEETPIITEEPTGPVTEEDPQPTVSAPAAFHPQRIGIVVASGTGMLATFLPWATIPIIGSIAGTAGDGWITLALFLPALGLALAPDRSAPLQGGRRLGAVVPAVIASLIGFWKIVSLSGSNDDGDGIAISIHIGPGLYLLVLSGIAIAAVSWARVGRRA